MVVGMCNMFEDCVCLKKLDLSSFSVINMRWMFEGCSKLISLDLSSFDTSNVAELSEMFRGCSKLSTIYVSNKWSIARIASSYKMFTGCINLPNYKSYKTKKNNAHYSKGGYLTLKR